MRSIFVFTCLLFSNLFFSQANFQYSESFAEPDGWTKLVQLRNGNTALVEVTKREGFFFTLYGADRKLISNRTKLALTQVGIKMGGPSSVPAIMDLGGNVVMFILFWVDDGTGLAPTLYRVTVDGKTGSLKEEVMVTKLDTYKAAHEMGKEERAGIGLPDVYVEKDSESDCYAILTNNSCTKEKNKIVGVSHFRADHTLITATSVKVPNGPYNSAAYLGAFVKNDAYVVVGSLALNYIKDEKENDGKRDALFLITKFEKGNMNGTQMTLTYKDYNQKGGIPKCAFVFNKVKNKVMMLLTNYTGGDASTHYYDIINQSFDPTNMTLDAIQKADLSKVNDYYRNKLKSDKDYNGMIQATSVTSNGNLILLYQTKAGILTGYNVPYTSLGDVGISLVSPEGKALDGIAINYSIKRTGTTENSFHYDATRKGRKIPFSYQDPSLGKSWYMNMDLVATDKANYLFFNNTKENFDKPETEKASLVVDIPTTNAFQYTFTNTGFDKKYLFGEPAGKKEGKFCNFTASSFDAATKTYCTMMVDVKEKNCKIVWYKLD